MSKPSVPSSKPRHLWRTRLHSDLLHSTVPRIEAQTHSSTASDPKLRLPKIIHDPNLDLEFEGRLEAVRELLWAGSVVNAANLDGSTALHHVSFHGELAIVQA